MHYVPSELHEIFNALLAPQTRKRKRAESSRNRNGQRPTDNGERTTDSGQRTANNMAATPGTEKSRGQEQLPRAGRRSQAFQVPSQPKSPTRTNDRAVETARLKTKNAIKYV